MTAARRELKIPKPLRDGGQVCAHCRARASVPRPAIRRAERHAAQRLHQQRVRGQPDGGFGEDTRNGRQRRAEPVAHLLEEHPLASDGGRRLSRRWQFHRCPRSRRARPKQQDGRLGIRVFREPKSNDAHFVGQLQVPSSPMRRRGAPGFLDLAASQPTNHARCPNTTRPGSSTARVRDRATTCRMGVRYRCARPTAVATGGGASKQSATYRAVSGASCTNSTAFTSVGNATNSRVKATPPPRATARQRRRDPNCESHSTTAAPCSNARSSAARCARPRVPTGTANQCACCGPISCHFSRISATEPVRIWLPDVMSKRPSGGAGRPAVPDRDETRWLAPRQRRGRRDV